MGDLMKKFLILGILLLVVVMILGCTGTKQPTKQEKEDAQLILQMAKCANESSAVDKLREACIKENLTAEGYTDGIDCTREYTNQICQDRARYNAESDAWSMCQDLYPYKQTLAECLNVTGRS